MIEEFIDWLKCWLIDWKIGRKIDWNIDWKTLLKIDWNNDEKIDCLKHWLKIDKLVNSIDNLITDLKTWKG